MNKVQTKSRKKSGASSELRRLSVEGDLNIYKAMEYKELLMEALGGSEIVELDLGNVGDVDSAGLQVLLLAKRESLASGKQLRIVRHSPSVQELLEFLNLVSYFGDPMVIPAQQKA